MFKHFVYKSIITSHNENQVRKEIKGQSHKYNLNSYMGRMTKTRN